MTPEVCRTKKAMRLGRGELGRHDEVALVLAVLVVDHDDDLAPGDGGHGLLDRCERPDVLVLASAALRSMCSTVMGRAPLGSSPRRIGEVPGQQFLRVLGHHVHLEVDPVARALASRAW